MPKPASHGLAAALVLLAGSAAAQDVPRASDRGFAPQMPLDCALGETCFIQNYVDRDPGPDARDYACGQQTYDAHKGTDFRIADLATMEAGVDVVAVADGRVLRARDGEADRSFRETGREAIAGRECGNALIIDHGAGWESQLCHLKQGSLLVQPGDQVVAGQRLARVGLSGFTEFPHLHIGFRKGGAVIDPFAPSADTGAAPSCEAGEAEAATDALWSGPEWRYRTATILNAGFASGPVDMAAIEAGALAAPGPDAEALVAYTRTIGSKDGDMQHFRLEDPDGRTIAEHAEPEGGRAQTMLFVGLRRPQDGWAPGRYRAVFEVRREGETVSRRVFHHDMPAG